MQGLEYSIYEPFSGWAKEDKEKFEKSFAPLVGEIDIGDPEEYELPTLARCSCCGKFIGKEEPEGYTMYMYASSDFHCANCYRDYLPEFDPR